MYKVKNETILDKVYSSLDSLYDLSYGLYEELDAMRCDIKESFSELGHIIDKLNYITKIIEKLESEENKK